MECFAASVALREREEISDRLRELDRERDSSWRDSEISDLKRHLIEVDGAIERHRTVARLRGG